MNQQTSTFIDSSPGVTWSPSLLRQRSPERYGSAWLISGMLHGLLLAVGLWGGTRILETPRPTIRLVFVEPPPPPPAPLTAPVTESVLPTPKPTPPVVEKPKERVQPKPVKPKEPERLAVVKKKKPIAELKPRQPEPVVPPPEEMLPEPEVAQAPAVTPFGVESGATSGTDNGVIGGVTGGHAGGVIGGHGKEPLPVDQVANPPLLLSRVVPDYPRQARLRGVEGLVLLEAILDLEGRIEDEIKVLQSIPLLDDAARDALRHWRFRPARDHDNQPVRVILEVPVRFVLK